MSILFFFIAVWYLSLFSQSFFLHRYAAHAAFKMNKFWERFFFVFTYITQGPHYMSPRTYAILHRLHHAHTDTELDPHSPSYSSNIFSMMWRTRLMYNDIYNGKVTVDEKYLKNLPEWPWFDKMASSTMSRGIWSLVYIAFFVAYATSPWQYLLLPIMLAMGALHGAIINWFAHKFGYKNFILKNTSMNLLIIDIFMLGESYHNNHHKRPSSINFGVRWHEVDPLYFVILFLNWLHVIKIPRLAAD
jgi:stearoyl-CoA desaturase (Delta-9 desaturase)